MKETTTVDLHGDGTPYEVRAEEDGYLCEGKDSECGQPAPWYLVAIGLGPDEQASTWRCTDCLKRETGVEMAEN